MGIKNITRLCLRELKQIAERKSVLRTATTTNILEKYRRTCTDTHCLVLLTKNRKKHRYKDVCMHRAYICLFLFNMLCLNDVVH